MRILQTLGSSKENMEMAPKTSDNTPEYKITVIPITDDGSRFYLEKYKPFRLASLHQDPQAFGSTYERELAFDDETWLGRIKNPLATTFVAVRADSSNQIVASTALIGPLPTSNPASNPYQVILGMPSTAAAPISAGQSTSSNSATNNKNNRSNNEQAEPLSFQMVAVYTLPTARGRGLAKALIKAATDEACDRAGRQGRPLALSVVVYPDNAAAISVYERCGFARNAEEEPELVFNEIKKANELTINMYYLGRRSD